jgi:hypothetical protein
MSHLTIDADSLANLLASVSDFSQVTIEDGQVTATDPQGDLTVGIGDLTGSIYVTAGGITFNIGSVAITKTQVRAEFTVAKPRS